MITADGSGAGGRGQRRRLGCVWEALVVAGLVAAFLVVAGLAGLTVYRLWNSSSPNTVSSSSGGSATGTPTSGSSDSQEG